MRLNRSGEFYVYMIKAHDGVLYTGFTADLQKRFKNHLDGHGAHCLIDKSLRLVYFKKYSYYKNALHAERNLKKLSREQKENLIKYHEAQNLALGAPNARFSQAPFEVFV